MKIVVDYALCEGNAVCEALAPDLFSVDNEFNIQVLNDEPDESRRLVVEQAVAGCPRLALSLQD